MHPLPIARWSRAALRIAASYYVTNGFSAAFGLLLISGAIHLFVGPFAAASASVGVMVCIPPDQAAPKRGKFWHLLPAALIGLPLFICTQLLHATPLQLGLLLVPATFLAFLGAAWGKRGLPIAISAMFAMVFSMAVPPHTTGGILVSSLYFALGAALYLVYATLANALLNGRYRSQMLADTLLALASLMRTQAQQFSAVDGAAERTPLAGQSIKQQAALADQLQMARDLLLESPRTRQRQRLAGMLMQVLEMRDHLLASELDIDMLRAQPGHPPIFSTLREVMEALAEEVERLADALLLGRKPEVFPSHREQLATLHWDENAIPADGSDSSPAMLARGLASRVRNIDEETLRLIALARGEAEPDLEVVRAAWQMFVSPTSWSWRPLLALWRWDAPPLRHAIRAALAIGSAYLLSLVLPWGSHDYWILLTIVVVLRGSLAQTLERRNSRVAGTLVGCVLAGALLAAHLPLAAMLLLTMLAQAIAHAFAIQRYLVTAVAATVLGLVQAHMLNAGVSPTFDVLERVADTLIGAGIAWAFSYVLPSWERTQIPALVARTLKAQKRHARVALGLTQLEAVDNQPELEWRLARREVYDSLSALVQATQRALSEPRAVQPPLLPLDRMLSNSYQLLAQLTAVKGILLRRRGRFVPEQILAPLAQAAGRIEQALDTAQPASPALPAPAATAPLALPDPFESDLSPWLLRRLDLAEALAARVREDAEQVLHAPAPLPAPPG